MRRERYARPGALPTVAPGSLAEDLERRDFHVNALALPLNRTARAGGPRLVDPGRGIADLEAGVLRVFHARSFHDDPTRALRAARLGTRLGFRFSASTRTALRDALREGAFGAVSGERYRREIERLFADARLGQDPAAALRVLDAHHVLPALEPGLHLPKAVVADLRRLGRSLAGGAGPVDAPAPWLAGLMLWGAGLPAPLRRRWLARLAITGTPAARVAGFPRLRDRVLRALRANRGRGAADAVLRPLGAEELLALTAGTPPPARRRILRFAAVDRDVALPVDGEDLVAAGLSGPAVGRALEGVRRGVLDGAVRSREDALALAREIVRRSPRRGGR